MTKLNGSAKPAPKNSDEALYNEVERLSIIAQMAGDMIKFFKKACMPGGNLTAEQRSEASAQMTDAMLAIEEQIKGVNYLQTLSRLVVIIAAASKNKHLTGATLTVSKTEKMIHLKAHYAPGADDFYDMHITPEIAMQLSEGLAKGVEMLKPKIIMPNSPLIGNA